MEGCMSTEDRVVPLEEVVLKSSMHPVCPYDHANHFDLPPSSYSSWIWKPVSTTSLITNIYRPSSGSKFFFLTELTDLIMSVGIDATDRFVLCSNFNMLGSDSNSIDSRLETLFDVHGIKQYLMNSTRWDKWTGKEDILDLLATSTTFTIVSEVSVVSSHHLSDHASITCRLSCWWIKLPVTSYTYRDIKQLDTTILEQQLDDSRLFTSSFNKGNTSITSTRWNTPSALRSMGSHLSVLASDQVEKEVLDGCPQPLLPQSATDGD